MKYLVCPSIHTVHLNMAASKNFVTDQYTSFPEKEYLSSNTDTCQVTLKAVLTEVARFICIASAGKGNISVCFNIVLREFFCILLPHNATIVFTIAIH